MNAYLSVFLIFSFLIIARQSLLESNSSFVCTNLENKVDSDAKVSFFVVVSLIFVALVAFIHSESDRKLGQRAGKRCRKGSQAGS